MTSFPVVKGYAMRATKVNSCGMPIAGPSNRLVTSGFISVDLTAVMRSAQDLEQDNAEGLVCVSDRTPPQRKWYTPAIELCNVDPELINLFSGWPLILDYLGNPIGYDDQAQVDEDFGVALEIWTGGKSFDDCPTPTSDSIFSTSTTGLQYGYFLFGGVEWEMGNIKIAAAVSTFTLTGRTIAMPQWGLGPYNVAGTDSNGTPGRMLAPMGQINHYRVFRTPVPPPEVTRGAVPLGITSIFTGDDYYYGGPSNSPPCAVAPDQADVSDWTITITGGPDSGYFTLLIDGSETDQIYYDASDDDVQAAVLGAGIYADYEVTDFDMSGGPLPTDAVVLGLPFAATVEVGINALGGGSDPKVTVTS